MGVIVTMSPFPARLGNRGYIKPLENRRLHGGLRNRDFRIALAPPASWGFTYPRFPNRACTTGFMGVYVSALSESRLHHRLHGGYCIRAFRIALAPPASWGLLYPRFPNPACTTGFMGVYVSALSESRLHHRLHGGYCNRDFRIARAEITQ